MKYTHFSLLSLVIATSVNSMETKQPWEIVKTFNQTGNVRAIDFNHNALTLAVASGDMKSHLFNVESTNEIQCFDNHNEITRAICIHNHIVATGSDDVMARVTNAVNCKEIHSFENKDEINAIKFNHAGNQLAVAANHTVRLFGLGENKRLISIQHQDQPISICFNKYDNLIITASLNKVRIFDIRTKEKVKSFYRNSRYIASVLTNSDNEILTVETPGNTIQIYNDTTKEIIDTHIPVTVDPENGLDRLYNGEPLFATCLHPNKKMLALGLYDKAVIFAQNNQK
jgi:WD40 repeat protein